MAILAVAQLLCPNKSLAAGVTVITHGFNSDVNGWVTSMADHIPAYSRFPGTNFTTYKVTLTTDGAGNYFYQWARTNGAPPNLTDSGEIIVKLDWSQMAGALFNSSVYDISTYDVASIASYVLLQTNAISELNGHALAEMPLHLIGHSRGGSLISEISRRLGTNGVWVDHLTTLDPHPLNNDGNNDSAYLGSTSPIDASAANTPATVLYADDFWQDLGNNSTDPNGEAVFGAFVRQLTSLSGGYSGFSATHSDVHLWYHGTLVLATPTSDTGASITSTQRTSWWTTDERQGTNAGFEYTLIGGSNRLSTDQPVGQGSPMIRDGFNQWWDFGAGVSANRAAPTTNNGTWASLIRLDRLDTNQVAPGQNLAVKLYYQWARPAASNALLSFFLDNDTNPFNTNQQSLWQTNLPGTSNGLNAATLLIPIAATNAAPGLHSLYATLTAGGMTRYLYAPEKVQILPSQQPPILNLTRLTSSQYRVSINGLIGQTLVLQSSSNLVGWQSLATNTLSTTPWLYTNNVTGGSLRQFYRTVLAN